MPASSGKEVNMHKLAFTAAMVFLVAYLVLI